jgi:predicted Co/Zn/Cd cation transporter (cation efflux family)
MACENANIGYGDIISKSVRILLVVITFGIVFEYMGLGSTIISISFLIIFGGIIMTLSLALGIGLSTVITDFIKEKVNGNKNRKK